MCFRLLSCLGHWADWGQLLGEMWQLLPLACCSKLFIVDFDDVDVVYVYVDVDF